MPFVVKVVCLAGILGTTAVYAAHPGSTSNDDEDAIPAGASGGSGSFSGTKSLPHSGGAGGAPSYNRPPSNDRSNQRENAAPPRFSKPRPMPAPMSPPERPCRKSGSFTSTVDATIYVAGEEVMALVTIHPMGPMDPSSGTTKLIHFEGATFRNVSSKVKCLMSSDGIGYRLTKPANEIGFFLPGVLVSGSIDSCYGRLAGISANGTFTVEFPESRPKGSKACDRK